VGGGELRQGHSCLHREPGFLAAGKEDDDTAIMKALSDMLNAAWQAGVRPETIESASADA
jgi:hypothetical protein